MNSPEVNVYLVGGAVRDKFLNKKIKDKSKHKKIADLDYLVTGATPKIMLKEGFEQVGADFPVFLHPKTKDEYALARTERKSGLGYGGFECDWKGVSLEDDLSRRDLTVNAMAEDSSGNLIDPYNGLKDLDNKVLRHVSDAFKEDPVRILRIARFMAKMPGFTIAPETHDMIVEMVQEGAITQLTSERVWKELHRAVEAEVPSRFFEALKSFGALETILPVLHDMIGVPQRADFHAEGDVFIHTMMVLDESVKLTKDFSDEDKLTVRMGALLHDVGKTQTEHELLYNEDGSMRGSHKKHDSLHRVKPLIDEIFDKYKMPDQLRRFCTDVGTHHQRIHGVKALKNKGFLKLFNDMNIKNRADGRGEDIYLRNLLLACKADARGRQLTLEDNSIVPASREYKQMEIMTEKFDHYRSGLKVLGKFFQHAFGMGLTQKDINIEEAKRACLMAGLNQNKDFEVDSLITRKQKQNKTMKKKM